MTRNILFLIICLAPAAILGQDKQFCLDTTYEINAFKKQGYISILSEWLLDYNKDEIYFLVKHKKKYFLNSTNINTGKNSTIKVCIENISKDLKRKVRNNAIRKICIKKPYLVIFYDNNFGLIFKLKNNKYIYATHAEFKHYPTQILMNKTHIFFCHDYIFHPKDSKDSKEKYFINAYNLSNPSPERIFTGLDSDLIHTTIGDRSPFFMYGNENLYTSPLSRIDVKKIDLKTKKISSVYKDSVNWSFIDKNASNRFSATFHTPFFQGFSYFDTWLKNSNSINSLGLINDTSLLIHYSDTCSGSCVVRNKWRLVNLNTFETTEITEGINSFMSYESNKITNCSYQFSSTGYSKYFYTKGGIILIEALPNFTPVGKTFIEYLTLKQEYLNSNKPILTVCKFEIR